MAFMQTASGYYAGQIIFSREAVMRIIIFLGAWFLISIPVGLLAARFLGKRMDNIFIKIREQGQ
jgi:hypothetical protein